MTSPGTFVTMSKHSMPSYHLDNGQSPMALIDVQHSAIMSSAISDPSTKMASTCQNQTFNLISPSSIPNPSPSTSSKPSFLQDSLLHYQPYGHPIKYQPYQPLQRFVSPVSESNPLPIDVNKGFKPNNEDAAIKFVFTDNNKIIQICDNAKLHDFVKPTKNEPLSACNPMPKPSLQVRCEKTSNGTSFKIDVMSSAVPYPSKTESYDPKPNAQINCYEMKEDNMNFFTPIPYAGTITKNTNIDETGYFKCKEKKDEFISVPPVMNNINDHSTMSNIALNNSNVIKEPLKKINEDKVVQRKFPIITNKDKCKKSDIVVDDPSIIKPKLLENESSNINCKIVDVEPKKMTKCVSTVPMKNSSLQCPLPIINSSFLIEKIKEDVLKNNSIISAESNGPKEQILFNDGVKDSKVVALKRHHQEDNVDENDFENLITENQIYGNKIVIKEKSQMSSSNDNNYGKSVRIISDISTGTNVDNTFMPNMFFNKMQIRVPPSNKTNNDDNRFNNNQTAVNQGESVIVDPSCGINCQDQMLKTINPLTQSVSFVKTNVISSNKSQVLQTLLNKPNLKINDGQYKMNNNHNGAVPNKPILCHTARPPDDVASHSEKKICDKNAVHKPSIGPEKENKSIVVYKSDKSGGVGFKCQEPILSSIDVAEMRRKRKRMMRQARAKKSDRGKQKGVKSNSEDFREFRFSKKQYQLYVGIVGEKYFEESSTDESESESEEDERNVWNEVNQLIRSLSPPPKINEDKIDFLKGFELTTHSVKKDKELEKMEKSFKSDLVISAYASAYNPSPEPSNEFTLQLPKMNKKSDFHNNVDEKIIFLGELKLGLVSKTFKHNFETNWQLTLKDRIKRNGNSPFLRYFEKLSELLLDEAVVKKRNAINSHTEGQLQIMTEIKRSVSENNSLIKKAIDGTFHAEQSQNSIIPELAERNFTEITRLSNMANRSLRIFGRQHDSQRSFRDSLRAEERSSVVIPNVPKIISLKSTQDSCTVDISPATSMDEPRNCAAVVNKTDSIASPVTVVYTPVNHAHQHDTVGEQTVTKVTENVKEEYKWPGVEAVIESYKKYDEDYKTKHAFLVQENERLVRDITAMQTEATNLSAELRQLLSQQQVCEEQHKKLQASIDKFNYIVQQLIS